MFVNFQRYTATQILSATVYHNIQKKYNNNTNNVLSSAKYTTRTVDALMQRNMKKLLKF